MATKTTLADAAPVPATSTFDRSKFFVSRQNTREDLSGLQKIVARNQNLKEIESEELKLIRNLDQWEFKVKASNFQRQNERGDKQECLRVKRILEDAQNIATRKSPNLNVAIFEHMTRGGRNDTENKPFQQEVMKPRMEPKYTFPNIRNAEDLLTSLNGDHNRFLVYESIKNCALRPSRTQEHSLTPATDILSPHLNDLEVYDRLKHAAHRLIHNFEHLKGTVNEKNLNFPYLCQTTSRQLVKQSTVGDTRSIFGDDVGLRAKVPDLSEGHPAQRFVSSIKANLELHEKRCLEMNHASQKCKELDEDHKKQQKILAGMENKAVG